ncbi:MAG: glycine/sarcosine/betaine reductase component B subunit [Peptostreptococcus sp.]|uniref:glycine/sarcosine/betaine reductase component B subunit n=1 Tax=Peptostreptococcus sp. TaxID=1262 RepID=UPI002FC9109C
MGLGPSIKMTTLHHFNCPVTRLLNKEENLEFVGIIVDGVSELYDDKIYTAKRTADMAQAMRVDGAIVAIDGWGNHHVDFVNVIEQLGMKNIPSVGLSFVGLQGRLVCTNKYVDCVVDFNKGESGYENCVVGDNNLTEYDAMKAIALLKLKLKRAGKEVDESNFEKKILNKLLFKKYNIKKVEFGNSTKISREILTINRELADKFKGMEERIENIKVNIIDPFEHNILVNSNLDFMPIACKVRGELGRGVTSVLSGVTLMLTGVEKTSGFQPSNIGSSEGMLDKMVKFDQDGTPKRSDYIIHVDIEFKDGEARTAEGIVAAHKIADMILSDIRNEIKNIDDMAYEKEEFYDLEKSNKRKVMLVKIVSGLGNMYDTSMFPFEPGGFIGSRKMMNSSNLPYVISPNQCKDGAIHSLL